MDPTYSYKADTSKVKPYFMNKNKNNKPHYAYQTYHRPVNDVDLYENRDNVVYYAGDLSSDDYNSIHNSLDCWIPLENKEFVDLLQEDHVKNTIKVFPYLFLDNIVDFRNVIVVSNDTKYEATPKLDTVDWTVNHMV